MGNLITKVTTNSVELNESSASDIVVYEQPQVKKDKTPQAAQAKGGLLKSMFLSSIDPRSPTTFITRTPIQIFRSASSSKFNHQELNESLNESVEIDILTAEEQESLDSNKDLVNSINNKDDKEEAKKKEEKLPDPRSPTEEIVRTPILIGDNDNTKKTENKLMKKIADKLIATKISNESDVATPTGIIKKKSTSKVTQKNLIYEDDEAENYDRFSTPPKKSSATAGAFKDGERTPLSCVANKTRSSIQRPQFTSTPKGSKIPVSVSRDNQQSASRIPRRIE